MQYFERILSQTDTGKSSNQCGFFVPKAEARSGFFPLLDESNRNNPRCRLPIIDELTGRKFEANFIYYNKAKNEFRVTSIDALFDLHNLQVHDRIRLRRDGDIWYFTCKRSIGDRDIDLLINPQFAKAGGQGYLGSAEDRRAVELHAMRKAKEWLKAERFTKIKDCSGRESFDFLAFRGRKTWKVEVKGTTALRGDNILMTSSEVDLHRAERGATVLVIVSSVRLDRSGAGPAASGGTVWAEIGWDIEKWTQTPTAFRVSRVS